MPSEEKPSESEIERPISYGAEILLNSGHADRGFVISDRPVIQPEAWVSGSVAEFSVWSNFTLTETTDNSRPQILEFELTHEHEGRKFSIAPAARAFFYHDPVSIDSTHSTEVWLYMSYGSKAFRLFTNHSVDVQTFRGAYFVDAGIESEGRVSRRVEMGGSLAAGWASSKFNDAYADVATSGLNRIQVKGRLTVYVKPHVYIGPQFEYSTIVNNAVRAALERPTFVFVGLTTGVEF